MKWETVKLGDICTKIGSGATPKGGSTVYIDEGTAFIRSQNVYNLRFDYEGLVFINDSASEKLKGVTIEENDILLNITGDSVARTCIVPSKLLPARVNQHVAIVRPYKNILNPKFLNYYLASPYMQSYMLGLAVGKGASRNAITKDMIENFEIPCPPIDTQRRIASILSAYDDLIENNQKQIKLLEEAASRLYKEWFVDFSFPGHESVPVVDGLPQGWRKEKLGGICVLRKEKISSDKIKADIPYIGLEHMPKKDFCLSGWGDSNDVNSDKFAYYVNDILFGKIRPYFHKVGYAINNGVASTDAIIMVAKKDMMALLLLTVSSDIFVEYTHKTCKEGSKMPRADWEQMKQYQILIPDFNTLNKFNKIIDVIKNKITALAFQCIVLKKSRYSLLPRLMSGEIEV